MLGDRASITAALEGDLDEALLRRVLARVGLSLGAVHGLRGKGFLLRSLQGYNSAARHAPWVVVVDLDRDCECAPPCVQMWLPRPAPLMHFGVAVRAAEAWLLSDRDRIAQFLGVKPAIVPLEPDRLDDPKQELVNLARRSRRRGVREDLVPRPGSGRSVGPAYTTRMIEFVQDDAAGWRVDDAAQGSESLARLIGRLQRLRVRLACHGGD